LVIAAADADLMLGVVSGALRAEVEGALRQLGLRELFKTVVTAENVAAGKPHPEGYSLGLQNLSSLPPLPSRLFHPHEVLAIEDSPAGLAAAAAAGLATLGVAHTYPLERLAMADHGVETIGELSLGQLRRLFSE
jgi:beta-phosphoglucomutase-like phosphatase (HAD superfamily)